MHCSNKVTRVLQHNICFSHTRQMHFLHFRMHEKCIKMYLFDILQRENIILKIKQMHDEHKQLIFLEYCFQVLLLIHVLNTFF